MVLEFTLRNIAFVIIALQHYVIYVLYRIQNEKNMIQSIGAYY